tara:strand:+ start:179 stop:403 length:225 start_codon:yes stop_codon:yes gene_type:complete
MGTYQKIKQAKADITRLEKELDQSAYWADYAVRKDQLESARRKYRTLNNELTVQNIVIVLAIIIVAGVVISCLL